MTFMQPHQLPVIHTCKLMQTAQAASSYLDTLCFTESLLVMLQHIVNANISVWWYQYIESYRFFDI